VQLEQKKKKIRRDGKGSGGERVKTVLHRGGRKEKKGERGPEGKKEGGVAHSGLWAPARIKRGKGKNAWGKGGKSREEKIVSPGANQP